MTVGEQSAVLVERRRVAVRGLVQGVGFRPFVHGLATELGLAGYVTNTGDGVLAEVEGHPLALGAFCLRIGRDAPPLAAVASVEQQDLPVDGLTGFTIRPSASGGGSGRTLIPPDVATCADCLAELADPDDRRFRHPFITCTNCGPRFTIVTGLPYDRASTTMAGFPMCADCAREYTDPADRRFHAQPISCHACGPRLTLELTGGERADGADALDRARAALAGGALLAVKGIGGYHLACDAANPAAVAELRRRKRRGDKPFAVMAADTAALAVLVEASPEELALLADPARPIVLLRRRPGAAGPAEAVAPRSPDLGVMLPYTPLHRLLFGLPGDRPGPQVLVMTSGNLSGEPIVTDDARAREVLGPLVDGILAHDRPIHVPCDDSVMRVVDGEVLPLRRSRGHAPRPIALPVEVRPVLAVGGDLKNAFALAEGRTAWPSAHVGDMDDLATLRGFDRAVEQLAAVTGVRPTLLAADAHPRYRSAEWARRHAGTRPVLTVQHHHAHVAAAMAEHGLDGSRPVLGIAFDGTGYGTDGAVWGGEVLVADYDGFRRFAHLGYVPLPGGDAAVERPYRMAVAHLWAAGLPRDPDLACVRACPAGELRLLEQQLARGFNCVPTSSMGRLFDAVSSLAGVCHRVGYEAQAAVELEAAALACRSSGTPYSFRIREDGGPLVAEAGPVLAAVVADVRSGAGADVIARRFHGAVTDLVVRLTVRAAEQHGLDTAALTGGVFANALLAADCARRLRSAGLTVLRHRLVPPNDGGLALGQLVVAGRTDR
ncbi:carbamoyltransferase HypF [Kitasatospora sp. NPDC059571]|uniref:carbamoyltransferase HypF n=1 Tax=Kitasatospora sp. NPDC059571 TaxID=3346871 RepID=UPI0036ABEF3E